MKRLLLGLALCMPLAFVCVGNSSTGDDQIVYICTGPTATVYHKTSRCKGLNRCSGEIKKITLQKAKSMNRRPCKICY